MSQGTNHDIDAGLEFAKKATDQRMAEMLQTNDIPRPAPTLWARWMAAARRCLFEKKYNINH